MTDPTEAAIIEHDLRALASQGYTVDNSAESFLAAIEEAEEREHIREADTRTFEQLHAEYGELHQRMYDARWYGTPEQQNAATVAYIRATEHPSFRRLYVHAAAVQVGQYVTAYGYAPDGTRTDAVGVVEAVKYTEALIDPYRCGERAWHYGFVFTLRPVARTSDGHPRRQRIWVLESGIPDVLHLPAPVDRGRPAWLDEAPTDRGNDGH